MRGTGWKRRRAAIISTFIAGFGLAMSGQVRGQYLTIYGGPTYDSSTGNGYTSPLPHLNSNISNGAAVGFALKSVAGSNVGPRAFTYGTSGTGTELQTLGTDINGNGFTIANSINGVGTIVGESQKYVGGINMGNRAVRWDASGMATALGDLGTDGSGSTSGQATQVNALDTAVGFMVKYDSGVNEGNRAVRWDASGTIATELGNLGTDSSGFTTSKAIAINDMGTIVGTAEKYVAGVDMDVRVVRWDSSGTAATEMGNIGGGPIGVDALNNAGIAVGWGFNQVGLQHAIRWDASGAATQLDNLASNGNFSISEANSVNIGGTAVGYSNKYGSGSLGTRAVRWDASGTAATELGSLGTSSTGLTNATAIQINDSDISVGNAEKYDSLGHDLGMRAVMWESNGAAIDLNTLIDPSSGWVLTRAIGISNDNWIAGVGSFDPDGAGPLAAYNRLFLIQVPEPTSMTLLTIAALALLSRRRMNP